MVAPFVKGPNLAPNNFHYKKPVILIRTGRKERIIRRREREAYLAIPALISNVHDNFKCEE
jgi:hypothetical protein